jgi:3-hydroxyisobutyrate dehydrogenase
MAANAHRLGWVGMGRMGYPMAERLLAAGHDLSICLPKSITAPSR